MFEDRAPAPISRLGPTRDRPFEATHFDRVEAGRRASDHQRQGRRAAPQGLRPSRPTTPARTADPTDPADERKGVGTRLDVRA